MTPTEFVDHYAKIFYQVNFAKGNTINYSRLHAEYIEQGFVEGLRGPARVGEARVKRLFVDEVFASSSLFYEEVKGPRRFRFYMDVDLSSLERHREFGVIPVGLANVDRDTAREVGQTGRIGGYVVGHLVANYALDVVRASGLGDSVVDPSLAEAEVVARLERILIAQQFSPSRHTGPRGKQEGRAYVPVEIHGTRVYSALKRMIESH